MLAKGRISDRSLAWRGREPKTKVDRKLNAVILAHLKKTGLPILSEETGGADWPAIDPLWIVDPLDGTFNFTRRLGPSAICICLWHARGPEFGAILDISSGEITWGGRAYGAWRGTRLRVSSVSQLSHAVLCTGFPAAFDFGDPAATRRWIEFAGQFAKVRMFGSAASSLLSIASGAADCYYEEEIQIWDVAAGMAVVEGAGGAVTLARGKSKTSVRLLATNLTLAKMIKIPNGGRRKHRGS